MKIKEIKAKSILTKSNLPDCDYCINPYLGCGFGCRYCYADFLRRFTGHKDDSWGDFVDVKVNAALLLEERFERLENKNYSERKKVIIGSVTDPYQGVEAKYKLTRKCLEVINASNINFEFTLLTKGHLVTRDIDILKEIKDMTIGITITSTDDEVSKRLEKYAPVANLRINTLAKLNAAGVKTYVCINPLLPHFVKYESNLNKLLDSIRKTGTREIWLEHINLSGTKLARIRKELKKDYPDIANYYSSAKSEKYKIKLSKMVLKMLREYDFDIAMGGIIDHSKKLVYTSENIDLEKEGWKVKVV